MKSESGDTIKLLKKVCYGTVYGLVEIEKGTVLKAYKRNECDDGVYTWNQITLENELGRKTFKMHVWDSDYIVVQD